MSVGRVFVACKYFHFPFFFLDILSDLKLKATLMPAADLFCVPKIQNYWMDDYLKNYFWNVCEDQNLLVTNK